MTEDTTQVPIDPGEQSNAAVVDESFAANGATEAATDSNADSAMSRTKAVLLRGLIKIMHWVYEFARATMITLVAIIVVGTLILSAGDVIDGIVAAVTNSAIPTNFSEFEWLKNVLNLSPLSLFIIVLGGYIAGYMSMQLRFRNTFGMLFRARQDARQLPVEKLAKLQQSLIGEEALKDFAVRYTKAWCSQDAASVAAFFAASGSLKVNDSPRVTGRAEITDVAQGFMTAFPDLRITMNDLKITGDRSAVYHWKLFGTHSGPEGTGKTVSISGREVWKIGDDGLIAKSQGYFDKDDYQRQIGSGVE